MDGNNTLSTYGYGNGIRDSIVEGNLIKYNLETSFVFVDCIACSIFNNRASDVGYNTGAIGLAIIGSNHSNVANNSIIGSNSASGTTALYVNNCSACSIEENIIDGNGTDFATGIACNTTSSNNTIEGNILDDCTLGVSFTAGSTNNILGPNNYMAGVTTLITDADGANKFSPQTYKAAGDPAGSVTGIFGDTYLNTTTGQSWLCTAYPVGTTWTLVPVELDDLTDVTLSSIRNGDFLYWDEAASLWKNAPLNLQSYNTVFGTDWAPSWSELEAHGTAIFFNTSIINTSHVGNGTVATLNALSPTAGDSYTVTNTGTLTLGSVSVTPGAIVIYRGTVWVLAVPGSTDGYVRGGVRVQLSTTTALISPYTDGTDDGKIFGFDNTDLTGVQTTADLTFTLPAPTGLPNDGMFRGPLYCGNFTGDHALTIDITSSGTFSDGLSSVRLEKDSESIMLGCVNGDLAQTWMRISQINDYIQLRRGSTWAATNFAAPTAVPFTVLDHAGNPDISYWDTPTNVSRLYAAFDGDFLFHGVANIDSTGGVTWTLECWLRVNGITEVPGSRARTGNYGNEDQSISIAGLTVALTAGDYVEWVFDHTSLTGNLNSCTLSMMIDY